jgi:ribosome biogenesis GTPase / thiamine phosphate phosphatase
LTQSHTLADLGWSGHFLAQLDLAEVETLTPARIAVVHRDRFDVLTTTGPYSVSLTGHSMAGDFAVGDWVLIGPDQRIVRALDRKSVLKRRAAGTGNATQLIAANVDTLFIVTSCNADFNAARLERYVALATEAGCDPVILLTKADTADDPAAYVTQAQALKRGIIALTIDARSPQAIADLAPWCRTGQTVALVGSSGTGKSTLTNTLAGTDVATQGIREDDAKGRHTTTNRALHSITGGGWIIDTPGMRELHLSEATDGITQTFSDVTDLIPLCRFNDCTHNSEPGCAVRAAIDNGTLDPARLDRWRKLMREDQHATATIAEIRAKDRKWGRFHKTLTTEHKRDKGR